MEIYFDLLVSTALFSVIFNLIFQWFYIKHKKFDTINSRSSHNTLATKTGGIALFTSLFFLTIYFYFTKNEIYDFTLIIPLSIIFVIGVYDDFYDADFKLKFLIQIIVAKLLIDIGFIINNFHGLFGVYEIPHLIAQLFTVFVFVLLVNAFNLIDGIDGLAISFAIFSIISFEYLNYSDELTPLNIICLGGILPLYYFNLKKEKKIFLGDAGSLFLGSIIALNLFHYLDFNQEVKTKNRILTTFFILNYPILDLIRVFFIRILNKKSPFIADRNHIHHLIVGKTKSHLGALIIIIFFNAILAIIMLRYV